MRFADSPGRFHVTNVAELIAVYFIMNYDAHFEREARDLALWLFNGMMKAALALLMVGVQDVSKGSDQAIVSQFWLIQRCLDRPYYLDQLQITRGFDAFCVPSVGGYWRRRDVHFS
jgi:hypothetical protein